MSATVAGTFLDATAVQLAARAGLAGVRIFTCPVLPEDLGKEAIELGEEIPIQREIASMGSSDVEESFTVTGSILVAKSFAKATTLQATINAAAKAARDRALAILEEVTDELATNDTMATGTPAVGTVRDVQMGEFTIRQAMAPEGQLGRVCWVEFTLEVQNHTSA